MFDRVLNRSLKPAEKCPFVSKKATMLINLLKYFQFSLPKIRVTNVDSFTPEAYFEPRWTFTMALFCENS